MRCSSSAGSPAPTRQVKIKGSFLLLVLVLVGCSSSSDGADGKTTPAVSPMSGGPYLAVLSSPAEQLMVASGHGKLIEKDGCVVLDDALDEPTLVVWPPGYGLKQGTDSLEVFDETGRVFAAFGETVEFPGGYAGQYRNDVPSLNALLAAPVPPGCVYDYVFMGYAAPA